MPNYLLVSVCERSGTSILAETIGTHPSIRMKNEEGPLFFIAWLQDLILSDDMGRYKKWYNPIMGWKIGRDDKEKFVSILREEWINIYQRFCGDGYSYIGDKWTELTRGHFDMFNELVSPKWILIWREKEANLASMRNAYWNQNVPDDELSNRYDKCTNFVLSKSNESNCLIVKYEELCQSPKIVMNDISKFLCVEDSFDVSNIGGIRVS